MFLERNDRVVCLVRLIDGVNAHTEPLHRLAVFSLLILIRIGPRLYYPRHLYSHILPCHKVCCECDPPLTLQSQLAGLPVRDNNSKLIPVKC